MPGSLGKILSRDFGNVHVCIVKVYTVDDFFSASYILVHHIKYISPPISHVLFGCAYTAITNNGCDNMCMCTYISILFKKF